MDITKLIDGKLGKRMVAFGWACYEVAQTEDLKRCLIIAALAGVYMVCQTISDHLKGKDNA